MSTEGENVLDDAGGVEVPPPDMAQIEADAREIGWVPKEQFRGDPSKWTDAQDFLEYGQRAVPALKATNRKLSAEMERIRQQNLDYERRLKANEAALKAVTDTVVETRTTDLKTRQAEIQAELDEAIESNDLKRYNSLRDELDTVKEQIKNPPRPAVDTTTNREQAGPVDIMASPEFARFQQQNPWFQTNTLMSAAAIQAMADLNRQLLAENRTLSLAQKFAHVETAVKKAFNMDTRGSGGQQVEPSRGGADSGGGDGTGKTYADLPPDAKAACDEQAQRFVGRGKFKTTADWRKQYVAKYFE